MAIFIRNCQPANASATTTSTMLKCWFLREMLLAGRWSENSNDGDAAWSSVSNLLLSLAAGANGLAVDASKPREVYSPNGDFLTSHVGHVLNLDATNDQNRGLWKITEYVDAYTVKVDYAGWFEQGWITETGMAARITYGTGAILANGAWVLMDAPGSSNTQVRIYYEDNGDVYVYVRPRGKLADPTEIASLSLGAYYMQWVRYNAYLDEDNFLIVDNHRAQNSGNYSSSMVAVGRLLAADVVDTDPIFVISNNNGMTSNPLRSLSMRMLDSSLTQIEAYSAALKNATGVTFGDLYGRYGRRLHSSNLAPLRAPWVCLANTASVGACVRGKLPMFRITYTGFEKWTPMDAAGDWQHLSTGIVIPRNGPNDPLIMWPEV